MPALPSVPNVIKVELFMTVGADANALVRQHIAYTGGPPSSADATALAASLYTIYSGTLAVYMGNQDFLTGVRVTDLSSPSGGQGEHLASTQGSQTGLPLASQVCALASMTIARRYRGGKPRTYFRMGDDTDLQTEQTFKAASLTNWNASLAAQVADIAVTTHGTTTLTHLVNVSYYHGFTVVTSPTTGRARNVPTLRVTPVVDPVLAYTFETKTATQRRRVGRQP